MHPAAARSEHDSPSSNPTPSSVVFVVHGMGSQLSGYGKFAQNVGDLRRTCVDVAAEELSPSDGFDGRRVEWIPIEWHSKLHSLESVDSRMQLCTLPTTPIFRQINNDMLADVLLFFSSYHGAKIVEIVANLLNQEYRKFLIEFPDFNGPICILGHSLGGIITYDLLANQDIAIPSSQLARNSAALNDACRTHSAIEYPKLDFLPDFFITLGSQVGAVMVMRGQTHETYKLPPQILYRNIFHLYDPLAYRIEPLIDSRYAEISPVLLQRPSAASQFSFGLDYYRSLSQLLSSYLPTLPSLPLNDLVGLQNMLPAVAALSFPTQLFPDLSSMPSVTMPSFSEAKKAMVDSVYGFAGVAGWAAAFSSGHGPHGVKRSHGRDMEEIDNSKRDLEDDASVFPAGAPDEDGNYKRRRVDGDIDVSKHQAEAPNSHLLNHTTNQIYIPSNKSIRKIVHPTHKSSHRSVSSAQKPKSEHFTTKDPHPQVSVTPLRPSASPENDLTPKELKSPKTSASHQPRVTFPFSPAAFLDRAIGPRPRTSVAGGVIETIKNAVRRVSDAFTIFDEEDAKDDDNEVGTDAVHESPVLDELLIPAIGLVDKASTATHRQEHQISSRSVPIAPKLQRRNNSAPAGVTHSHSQHDVEEVLTEELAAAAERALKKLPKAVVGNVSPGSNMKQRVNIGNREEKKEMGNGHDAELNGHFDDDEETLPLKERLDYFVTETVLDSTIHQYLIGVRAHFSYWDNKDIMYGIISTLSELHERKYNC